mgnify:FL=1|jgi:hypothetical protein
MARRKKNKVNKKPKGLQELSGYSVGQYVYALSYPNQVIIRGKIDALFKTEDHEFMEIIDDIGTGYRIALLSDVIDKPTSKHINAANSKIAAKMRKHEREQESKKAKIKSKG